MLNRTTPIILTEIRGSISSWRRLSNRNGNLRLSLTRHLANGRNTCKWPTVLTTKLTDWKVSQTRLNPRSIATPELEVPRLWTLHTRISRSYFKRLRTKTCYARNWTNENKRMYYLTRQIWKYMHAFRKEKFQYYLEQMDWSQVENHLEPEKSRNEHSLLER